MSAPSQEEDGKAGHRRLLAWTLAAMALGGTAWLAGLLLLRAAHPTWAHAWNALWSVAGISFLGAVVLPLPGFTSTLLFALRSNLAVGLFGVLGAGIGGTVGAGLLLALGGAGRSALQRHAHRPWARRFLAWSSRVVQKWTYAGVGALLVPPFIPRVAVLYPAVTLRLETASFLASVLLGTLARNALVLYLVVFAGRAWG